MPVRVIKRPVSPQTLHAAITPLLEEPLALVAMGNPMRGDDAAAIQVAQRLEPARRLRLFCVETALESFLMPIATCGAKSCMLMDALDGGAEPGDVLLLDAEDLVDSDFSTHALSPKAFLVALQQLSAARILVLGVQPGAARTGERLSPPVQQAVDALVSFFKQFDRGAGGDTHGRSDLAAESPGTDHHRP